jgi:hypothetical protein
MKMINALKVISGILGIFVTLPIWYYILYQVLTAIKATELTWFLFWVYLPVSIFVSTLTKIIENSKG